MSSAPPPRVATLANGESVPLARAAALLARLGSHLRHPDSEWDVVFFLRELCLGRRIHAEQRQTLIRDGWLSEAGDLDADVRAVILSAVRGEGRVLRVSSPFTDADDRAVADYLNGRDHIAAFLPPAEAEACWLPTRSANGRGRRWTPADRPRTPRPAWQAFWHGSGFRSRPRRPKGAVRGKPAETFGGAATSPRVSSAFRARLQPLPRETPMPALRSHAIPNAIRIRTYADLMPWLLGFRADKFHLLFLVGTPGLGKSRLIREALAGRDHLMVEGHATPLKTYAELYRHRDQPVVIDDEDSFHADPQKVRLMKCLCTTEPVKRLTWQSTTKLLEEMKLEPAFVTTSKVAVLANNLSATNPHVAALFDRGCVLSFEPSAGEVHDRVADWFTDREIHAFFGRWLSVIPSPSMRLYAKAAEMKAAGIDWRAVLMGQWKAGRVWRVEAVQADPDLHTEEARATAFEAAGWGSRATYFRHLDRWRTAIGGRPVPVSPPG